MADMTTHLMIDDVTVSTIEAHDAPAFAVAGYVNGLYNNWNALVAHYAGTTKFLLSIDVMNDPSAGAQCLDIENGDATNADAPNWVKATAAAGRKANDLRYYPKVYTSAGNAKALIDTLSAAGVPRNGYMLWSAHYTNTMHICGPNTCGYPQADATQYTDVFDGASLDGSLCYGYFFSGPPVPVTPVPVSPPPAPTPVPAPPPPPAPAPPPPPPAPPAEPVLQEGATGAAVKQLQNLLDAKLGAGLSQDGVFGPATKAAVEVFQSHHGLTVDGVVGPLTWAALKAAPNYVPPPPRPTSEPVLRYDPNDTRALVPAVKLLQTLLNNAGYRPLLNEDGFFGSATLNAVEWFQRRHGLVADGVVGPLTWAKLGNYS